MYIKVYVHMLYNEQYCELLAFGYKIYMNISYLIRTSSIYFQTKQLKDHFKHPLAIYALSNCAYPYTITIEHKYLVQHCGSSAYFVYVGPIEANVLDWRITVMIAAPIASGTIALCAECTQRRQAQARPRYTTDYRGAISAY